MIILIVAIGASAGGIEALRSFFTHLPDDTSLSFIVVLHLAPDRESKLAEILGRWTKLPVEHPKEGDRVAPGHVYVIEPNVSLTLQKGRFRLRPLDARAGRPNAIDLLFGSVAAEIGDQAVGIVLSGTGTDGALGLKEIREAGGFTLAQSPNGGPHFPEMAHAAIASGNVDLVLPVEAMPSRLIAMHREFASAEKRSGQDAEAAIEAVRPSICASLKASVGHDFAHYKKQTFFRRVQRRLLVLGLGPQAYATRLETDAGEARRLFRELLIGVTSFFRDNVTFDKVAKIVLPRLFAQKGPEDSIRIWVPGCATGEEAYSLAILLREYADRMPRPPAMKVFATDIDDAAIGIARAGRYAAPLLDGLSPERLERFFVREGNHYLVNKEIRDLCTFSVHSVIRDPPFSRMGMVSCRNLLIYLDAHLQGLVIPAFHYALVPGGVLMLGGSETVAGYGELFAPIDAKQRIFERRDTPTPPLQVAALTASGNGMVRAPLGVPPGVPAAQRPLAVQMATARIREQFTPPFVLVDDNADIVHHSAMTGRYLEAPTGAPSRNLYATARPGLRHDLRTVLNRVRENGQASRQQSVMLNGGRGTQQVELVVEQVTEAGAERLFMVVFRDMVRIEAQTAESGPLDANPTVEALERELRDSREYQQSTREEYETALEELKSSNEELHSVNEELQSANEELETSKEEIQSINEEMITVNTQLNSKLEELDLASSDLRNIFESTQVATIFLDCDMIIRGFTPAVKAIYNLLPSDHGRSLTDIVSRVPYPELHSEFQQMLATLKPVERRVTRPDTGTHFLARILPYRVTDSTVMGGIVTFVDVTAIVQAEEQLRLLLDELNHRVRNMLAVVLSLATNTLRSAGSLAEFGESFTGRLHALATVYTLLSRQNWTEVTLPDLVREELAPLLTGKENIVTEGPNVLLGIRGALALGMIVHELATNAKRFGALSSPEGSVRVAWHVNDDGDQPALEVHWHESGGPPVAAAPQPGFGLKLVERSLSHELNGVAAITFAPEGLQTRLTIPLEPGVVRSDEPPGTA
ncbi:MAG: cheR [Rubritepida sp.]|nr:cheR [Rubritepida sp.]